MTEKNQPKIGFIGLGLMGSAMVQRLQDLNYSLVVMAHRNRKPIDAAVARGAEEVTTPKDVAASSDIIMLCVDTTAAVEAVMRGEDGVISGLQSGAMVVDFGTSIPSSTRALAGKCKEKGASMMDAPLGRTPAQAVDGLLNIMSAGDTQDFEKMKPVFEDLGENVFHVGPIGAGHTLKLINNFYGMTTACAMSEAFAMADLAGIERVTLYNVMSSGPLKSGMMEMIKFGAVDNEPEKMAFSIGNALKDVGYYSSMADDFQVPSLLSASVKNGLSQADSSGFGDKMVPEMVNYIAELFAKK
jgi:3-hydroxyisobutyrate dehydrogenase-like beta-hydroxyacid dehydrogenase